jgi:hypothetical protein
MTFTALHRALGDAPGPFTDEMLEAAIRHGVTESEELDWKSAIYPEKGLANTDFPKDVAAMANSGGGVIICGVVEADKAATARNDVELTEGHERTLHSVAISAITPPVFGLKIHRVVGGAKRAVVIEVPKSIDGPHLIYRNDYFGAPRRNDADTVWMKEREIEAMYRARFDERRHSTEALDGLFKEAAAGRDTNDRAWFIAVAHPRIPNLRVLPDRDQARAVLADADLISGTLTNGKGTYPLRNVDRANPRPGLRRWVAVNTASTEQSIWREAWASIHHDGSVTLAVAVGGQRSEHGYLDGNQVQSSAIECAVADFMALIRANAKATENAEYEARVGIVWTGQPPLQILTVDNTGRLFDGVSTPLHTFTSVETTVDASESDNDFEMRVRDLARDCVNQGGISNLHIILESAQ